MKAGERNHDRKRKAEVFHVDGRTEEGYIEACHGKGTFCSEKMRHMKKSRNIAVVTTYISDYIFPRLIQGIDNVLSERGYSIILKNTGNSRQKEANYG